MALECVTTCDSRSSEDLVKVLGKPFTEKKKKKTT